MYNNILLARPMKLWLESFTYGIVIMLLCITYKYLRYSTINTYAIYTSIAFAGMFLILVSHAISGTSYFWNIGRLKLGHRKTLGVTGLIFGIIHATIALAVNTDFLSNLNFFYDNIVAILVAYLAIAIFIFMVVISNFGIPARLGAVYWRKILRTSGYIGIILIMIHFTIFYFARWTLWFTTFSPLLPPLSLLLILFSIATLILRLALWYSLSKKTKNLS